MRIDAHQHFWRYQAEAYRWIDDDMCILRRDFLPADLQPLLAAAGVDGTVVVQARQSLAETDWLLGLADAYAFIHGVVGWVPLMAADVDGSLERLAAHPALKAVRHVMQGAPEGAMLRNDFNCGVARLAAHRLAYDILIYEQQLPEAILFVDRHPGQRFVLDHCAKPRIAAGELEPWRTQIRELARRPNVACKLSGLVTEADVRRWTEAHLRPFIDTVLEAFGPRRILFGSDWPVCRLACDYGCWHDMVARTLATLSVDEQQAIWGDNAREIYNL